MAIEQDPLLAERKVSASLGVGSFPDSGATPEDILRAADTRMYSAKKGAGGNGAQRGNPGIPEKVLLPLYALARALDMRRDGARDHSLRVATWARRIARRLKLPADLQTQVEIASRLHDIGKSEFGPELFQRGLRTPEEEQRFRQHPRLGADLLRSLGGLEGIAELVACHHERLDGSGFPEGIGEGQLPAGAAILAVAEEFVGRLEQLPADAASAEQRRVLQQMQADFPHAFPPDVVQALQEEIEEGSETAVMHQPAC
jgi:putative nucleotidyltransferase with HDIG domain